MCHKQEYKANIKIFKVLWLLVEYKENINTWVFKSFEGGVERQQSHH